MSSPSSSKAPAAKGVRADGACASAKARSSDARGRVSIVISSFNYEQYLGAAITSALAQRGTAIEVIVVDDGSHDRSPAVIDAFGDRVSAIHKDNRGQASALNAGFEASTGEAVIFLDSDDMLLPSAAVVAAQVLSDRAVAKLHWSMPIIDAQGRRTGEIQDAQLAAGDLRRHVFRDGPLSDATLPSPPMSGNAFPRWFLEHVMPIPECTYRIAPDESLFGLAPAFGPIVRAPSLSLYRMHGENAHRLSSFEQRLAFQEEHFATVAPVAAAACRDAGVSHDEQAWRQSAWWLRTARAVRAIETAVPAGERVALIDQGLLGVEPRLRGRIVAPFPEMHGEFAGPPASDLEALAELERVRASGTRYVAFAWPAFWWLDHYPRLASALRSDAPVLAENPDVVIFGPHTRG